jgi:carbon storage regulator
MNEEIIIGDNISVSIIEIKNDQVKIGVSAPKNVKVFRRELFDEIRAQNREAARSAQGALSRRPLPVLDGLS